MKANLNGKCELANNEIANIGVHYRKNESNSNIFADMDVDDSVLPPLSDLDYSVITVTDDSLALDDSHCSVDLIRNDSSSSE